MGVCGALGRKKARKQENKKARGHRDTEAQRSKAREGGDGCGMDVGWSLERVLGE
jgi:hypothetical protein